MATISWVEGSPAGGDSVGLGASEFRSLKTALRTGLDSEHVWPSASGDAGVHRLGSCRPFVGTQSAVSSGGTDGRTMWASDTSNYFHVGSGGTVFLGGPRVLSVASYPGGAPPQRQYWAMEFGTEITNTGGSVVVSIPNSGFSSSPYVQLTAIDGLPVAARVNISVITPTAIAVVSYKTTGASASSVSFYWQAIGLRAL